MNLNLLHFIVIFCAFYSLCDSFKFQDFGSRGFQMRDQMITVSGISSGGFMANQFHMSFSSIVKGAAITAGGPFYCSLDNLALAVTSCMENPEYISVSELEVATYEMETAGTIDPLSNIKGDRVWLFSGTRDTTVRPGVVRKLEEYYKIWIKDDQIATVYDIPAVHSQVTKSFGNPCGVLGNPYIVNCDYDSVGAFLPWIMNETLNAPVAANSSSFYTMSQTNFHIDTSSISMGDHAYVYIPEECTKYSSSCRLHVAFHGCEQSEDVIGTDFVMHAGYNEWAESNNIIILYPQAKKSLLFPLNPKGCWDWWGYTGVTFPTKYGPQMIIVKELINSIFSAY